MDDGTISSKIAKQALEEMAKPGDRPEKIVEDKGLVQISDPAQILPIIEEVIANNPDNVAKFKAGNNKLLGFAFGETNKFMHIDLGYNYRLTNLQAAIGCAQLERIDDIIERKRTTARRYNELLHGEELLQLPVEKPYARNVYWMYHVALRDGAASRRANVMHSLAARGIETREGFIPANQQEIFQGQGWTQPGDCPRANVAGATGFYLPSGPSLTANDVEYVVANLREVLSEIVMSPAASS